MRTCLQMRVLPLRQNRWRERLRAGRLQVIARRWYTRCIHAGVEKSRRLQCDTARNAHGLQNLLLECALAKSASASAPGC